MIGDRTFAQTHVRWVTCWVFLYLIGNPLFGQVEQSALNEQLLYQHYFEQPSDEWMAREGLRGDFRQGAWCVENFNGHGLTQWGQFELSDREVRIQVDFRSILGPMDAGVGLVFGADDLQNGYKLVLTRNKVLTLERRQNGKMSVVWQQAPDWPLNDNEHQLSLVMGKDLWEVRLDGQLIGKRAALPKLGNRLGVWIGNSTIAALEGIFVYQLLDEDLIYYPSQPEIVDSSEEGTSGQTPEVYDLSVAPDLFGSDVFRKKDSPLHRNAAGRTSHLLLIGVDQYKHWDELSNAVRDCDSVGAVLSSEYQCTEHRTYRLYDEAFTAEKLFDTLVWINRQMQYQDELVIYLAGHGERSPDSTGYIVPVDGQLNSPDTYISMTEMIGKLKALGCHRVTFILDACYGGSILVNPASYSFGLAGSHYGPQIHVLASNKYEMVSDGREGENSPFAKNLVRTLRESEFGSLTLSDLQGAVARRLARETIVCPEPIAGTIE
ncbi:caspase family protein [Pontibacter sp. G13]|uniref:caspase family protein n=1 Tax=Pontibacter sp. G13 TaxID=3074898 RepID=UPI00288B274C|nr:caspase family protein [Pontibacter sp. G13]WNJ18995.1 caspase family protein [Pontibacter sp. G13]